jgi:hypothetical protein
VNLLEQVLDDLLLMEVEARVDPVGTVFEFDALVQRSVTSPPSSTTSCGPLPPGKLTARQVRSQYSSSVSPFQAKTGVPALAMAAAA